MAPSEQAMLADSFPPSKRAQAFAAYGVAVIVAPALGPTIGGYLTDNASWHWIFFINVPIGAVSLALVAAFVDEPRALIRQRLAMWRRGLRIDWVGFVLVALFLGFLEIVLDKGQEDDWFNSPFITACAVIAALSFLAFVPWELSRDDPIVDIRLIGRRNFGASFAVMLAVGAVLFGTTQLMPQLLQGNFGYTATLAGLSLMPGGFASLTSMLVAGQASRFVQPRWMMAGALIVIGLSPAPLHRSDARRGLLVVRLGASLPDGGVAVPVPDHHQLFLCRPAARQIRAGFGADQRGAQPRRQYRRLRLADSARLAGAVPSSAPG